MRIIGSIDHPIMKITIFKMDTKLSVKFETGLYEQTYKFREGDQIDTLEAIKELVNPAFQQAVLEEFNQLNRIKMQGLAQLQMDEEDEFEEII